MLVASSQGCPLLHAGGGAWPCGLLLGALLVTCCQCHTILVVGMPGVLPVGLNSPDRSDDSRLLLTSADLLSSALSMPWFLEWLVGVFLELESF